MMKKTVKMSFMAMAMMVGLGGFTASANAQDFRHDERREPDVKVVVHQPAHVVAGNRGGLFNRLDINNDGAVSKWEFSHRYGNSRMAMRSFYHIDSNHTGKLSQREVAMGRGVLNELRVRG
jgi:hypothetical protein